MKTSIPRCITRLLVLMLLALAVFGCAAVYEEQEGGITGTGNQIECRDERYKDDPRCQNP